VGIEGERVEMFNIGASDAVLFARACDEMTGRAQRLGLNPLKKKAEVKMA
jgi:coenzyme F420-reducing hydrogenase delta subunit